MKKHYLFLGTALILSLTAQAYTNKLVKMYSDVGGDYTEYFYDETNMRLDSIFDYRVYDIEYFIGYKYAYDENGNQISQIGYQKLQGNDYFTNTTKVYYEYDESNRCISRTNYNINLSHTGFDLGGVYEYIWEGDLLVQQNMYWDINRSSLYEQTNFYYDDNGRLIKEECFNQFWGSLAYSYGIEYLYNYKSQLVEKKQYSNYNMLYSREKFYYDALGNISSSTFQYASNNDLAEKREYTYLNEVAATDVLYPDHREWDGLIYKTSPNALSVITEYAEDGATGELAVYDVYIHEYEPVQVNSVSQIAAPTRGFQVINAGGTIFLSGIEGNEQVRIYNQSGILMDMHKYNPKAGIDMTNLPNGIYIISTRLGSSKVVR